MNQTTTENIFNKNEPVQYRFFKSFKPIYISIRTIYIYIYISRINDYLTRIELLLIRFTKIILITHVNNK